MNAAATMRAGVGRNRVLRRRHVLERTMVILLGAATLLAAALLVAILGYVLVRGLPALDLAFFTERPRPFGVAGGGIAPALIGTVMIGLVAG